jgi:glycosyltransferase involved in cell wall biosynthesis
MKIAIQAADLDHDRIDGTRVYILNLLRHFGKLDQASEFLIYHRRNFNPELAPPEFPNYKVKKLYSPFFWTQTRFALDILKERVDVLWMPMHNQPILHRKKTKTFVTIHDLAFKYFPENFLKKDLVKINFLTNLAITNSDKIIAISEATKRDILKFFPRVPKNKIRVIYHGFNPDVYAKERNLKREAEIKSKLGITGEYILYIGAIQPRKNLEVLIDAFELLKRSCKSNLSLILAGERAWLSKNTFKKAQNSQFATDIKMPGKLKFDDLGHLCRSTRVFVFPSLYEGFGIPVLEAMAAGVPVISAKNSSLPEVGGEASLYFDAKDPRDLMEKIRSVLENEKLRRELVIKGSEQIKKFSWEKCARETLEYLKS